MAQPARRRSVETLPFEKSPSTFGRVIGSKYALDVILGDGSSGTVYRARQLALDKVVAIKVLHRAMSSQPSLVERFHREARAASKLDHASSIRVFDFGQEDDGLLYLVMEYVEGRDLLTLINEEGILPPRRVAIILSQVLAALAVAHEQGVIHRDLKPENILISKGLTDDGEEIDVVKVCDFGIAAIASDPAAMRLTARGLVMGTPEYMSPEQARGLPLDGRTDLYSVGVVLYNLLTGRVPFLAESPVGTAVMHVTHAVTPPSAVRPAVDPVLEAVCMRAMAKDPAERFASAREMRAAVRAVLDRNEITEPPAPPAPEPEPVKPRRRAGRLLPAMIAIAICALLLAGLTRLRDVRQRARIERAAAAAQLYEPYAPGK